MKAVTQLATHVVPGAVQEPGRWLFLVEPGAGLSDEGFRDQYTLATSIAHRLQIPVPSHPFAEIGQEDVLETAAQHGLPPGVTEDDLYGALCYSSLPKRGAGEGVPKSLDLARLHEPMPPRIEAVKLLRRFRWNIELDRLEEIVAHVMKRIETESVWVLDQFYHHQIHEWLAVLVHALNRRRLREWLEQSPPRPDVLIMMDEQDLLLHLPPSAPGGGWTRGDSAGTSSARSSKGRLASAPGDSPVSRSDLAER